MQTNRFDVTIMKLKRTLKIKRKIRFHKKIQFKKQCIKNSKLNINFHRKRIEKQIDVYFKLIKKKLKKLKKNNNFTNNEKKYSTTN